MSTRNIEIETSVSKAFMAQAFGPEFERDYYFDPHRRYGMDVLYQEFIDKAYPDLDALYTESNLGRKKHHDKRQVLVGGIQPNMIIGMLLGAEFIPSPGGDADISPACWADRTIEDLPAPDTLVQHPIIRTFDAQIRAIQREGSLIPIPPFFWDASGRAAIHGALTTAQKFLGEEVFMDMLTGPDRVHGVMDWICEANIILVRHFAALAGIEISAVHVGECSSCMIGHKEWEAFVIPTLNRIGRELGPVRLHSCGLSDHILETARTAERLYSLDLGGETSVAKTRKTFGPDFPVSIAPPVKLLAGGRVADLKNWTMNLLEANAGGRLTVLYHLEPQYPLPTIRAWHAWLRSVAS